ncbi:MFS transporter [Candidatus Jidaibacter acanthamoebae]|nr:MFS transporter [Candidatus Jidaibacter acanthamoeba]
MLLKKIFNNKIIRGAYLAWFAGALFYFYQYILRISPGIMVDQLTREFNLRAEEFATLGALGLFAYSICQIPLGIIVDKIGVKRTVLVSILLCITGSYLFAVAQDFWVAQLSRVFIGIGSGSAFMCALKIVADHFPPGKRAFLMGATLTLGTVGALVSGKTIIYVMESSSWRHVLLNSTLLGGAIFIIALIFINKNKESHHTKLNKHPLPIVLKNIIKIMKDRNILIYAILAIGLYTPLSVFTDLWGISFLKQKFNLSQSSATYIALMMYAGLSVGSLVLPWLSEKYNILNISIFSCGFIILIIFSYLLYGAPISEYSLSVLLVALGFFCGAEMMCFTGALQFSKQENSGEIIGVVNTLNMLGSAILQQLIGTLLDLQWDQTYNSYGNRQYTATQFINALSVLTGVLIFCCIISFSLKKIKVTRF